MYELKTLLPQFDINIPKCMYEMKNVSLSANAVEFVSIGRNNFDDMLNIKNYKTASATAASGVSTCCPLDLDKLELQIRQLLQVSGDDAHNLALRQKKVTQQLKDLKAQLAGIRSTLGLCEKGAQHTTSFITKSNVGLREEAVHDVVINGHPNFIPYGLLAVKNAWKDLFTLDVKLFTHSTMSDIGEEARAFENALKSQNVNSKLPKLNITLIWKNCEHTEMVSSPTMYVPIYGEVNIIRYLSRVGPIEYRYEDSPLCNEIDAVLDICYQLLRYTTTNSKTNMIGILNNHLEKRKYFGGDQISIADISVHSSLRRMHFNNDKDLTPTLNEWRKRVEKFTLI